MKKQKEPQIFELLKQHATEWGLDSTTISEAHQRIIADKAQVIGNTLLLFLYAKGILNEESTTVRKVKFRELLQGNTLEHKSALERLKIIVVKGETTPTNTPVGPSPDTKSFFEDFIKNHPEWKPNEYDNSLVLKNQQQWKNPYVVFRDHQKLKDKEHALVERFQKSGLCYMHAPVVLQHYLVAMTKDEPVPMLDMTQYFKQHMSPSQLYNHIWENKGGDSFDFLQSILFENLNFKDIIEYPPSQLFEADLCAKLLNYGPALVTGFHVSEEFKNADLWQHTGNQSEEFLGKHAMLLIGYRKFESEKGTIMTHYLLQNWWEGKAYIEVDIGFLASSKATVRFITKVQTQMGQFPTNYNVFVECDVDACEQFVPEGLVIYSFQKGAKLE